MNSKIRVALSALIRALIIGAALPAALTANAQGPSGSITDAIAKGTVILELRTRYEIVEQSGRPHDGKAATIRTRLGWQTAKWNGLQALMEVEDVRRIGPEAFDTSLNNKTTYGQVIDPQTDELNRLQIMWSPDPTFTATLGRQRINLDDQRFIGGSAWRQDEQTFDAARIDTRYDQFDATYIYIDHVNRIFARKQDWDSNSHVFSAGYSFAEPLKVRAFVYALDLTSSKTPSTSAQSSLTWGAKISGKVQQGDLRLDYAATAARQTDYASSPLDYSLAFASVEAAATQGPLTVRLTYDALGGNGKRVFSTSLGSLHAFNGWSDAFVINGAKTTVDGLRDANVTFIWDTGIKWDYLSNLILTARLHDFNAERTGADLGSELDLQVSGSITPQVTWLVKFADYDGPEISPAPAARTKMWFGLEVKL